MLGWLIGLFSHVHIWDIGGRGNTLGKQPTNTGTHESDSKLTTSRFTMYCSNHCTTDRVSYGWGSGSSSDCMNSDYRGFCAKQNVLTRSQYSCGSCSQEEEVT